MTENGILNTAIDMLLSSPVGEKLRKTLNVITDAQARLAAILDAEGGGKLALIRTGSVVTLFLIDTLASGKKAKEFTKEDWDYIAKQILQYAIPKEEQRSTVFVFTCYADYIDISAACLPDAVREERREEIRALALSIREQTGKLEEGEITEPDYVEACLWLALEAMVKLLSSLLVLVTGEEFAELGQAAAQLAFEYGRYVLYAKEQAILAAYLDHQRVLDEQLQQEYEAFLSEVQAYSDNFRMLLNEAFTPGIRGALEGSAALARAAGVSEEELLLDLDDVDSFFLN